MNKTGRIFIIILLPLIIFAAADCCADINLPASPLFQPIELAAEPNLDIPIYDTPSDEPAAGGYVAPKSISKTKAVFYSLLLPGAGHYYLGENGRGEVFTGAEIVSWAGIAAFQIYGNWKEDDYVRFAEEHAGVSSGGKDEDFYKNLTFYDSREDYNTAGRIIDPGDPYYPNTRAYYWQWDSDESQSHYRDIRNQSETAFRNRDFMIGLAVFNRIIAGIDAFRLARKIANTRVDQFGGGTDEGVKFGLKVNPFGDNPKFEIKLSRKF